MSTASYTPKSTWPKPFKPTVAKTAVPYRRAEDPSLETLPNTRTGAACAETDPELFFPFEGEADKIAEAKGVCSGCPLLVACGDFALRHPDLTEFGIWGGLTEDERTELHVKRINARLAEKREIAARHDVDQAYDDAAEVA